MKVVPYLILILLTLFVVACGREASGPPLFHLLSPDETGVTFVNEVVEEEGFNVLEYEYFYNGGGVTVGDINGDSLPDLYFTANMRPDHLYLNRGNLTFENITEQAGIQHTPSWTTGVTMADVNGDGWLDIYVCKSGRVSEDRRRNLLYLNDGDPGSSPGQAPSFTEQAAAFGLDDPAYSTHATFFDYDRDGDLDLYLLNHPIRRFSNFDVALIKRQRDPLSGDKLYRNDDGIFVDVTEQAGIIANPLGFGLSAQVSDLNKDGWPDLYIANDYIEDDYLYLNNRDGTFTESIRAALSHTSYSSMGTDIADVNNDALPDIVTLDMLAEDNRRQKLLKGPEDFAFYEQMRERGFHEQYMYNMLHINNGDLGAPTFTEIGQLAGVSNTDWSWAPLFADFDNDGLKDLFVTNGYLRDYTNLDFLHFTLVEAYDAARKRGETLSSREMVQHMPTTLLSNYLFRNNTASRPVTGQVPIFSNVTQAWGLADPSISNGAAYADLDNDGDLDLVINNVNQEAFIYRNDADQRTQNNYLKLRLEGEKRNRFGVGAKVTLAANDRTFYQEQIPSRGYQSAVEPVLLFGLGDVARVTIEVVWPDGTIQRMEDVAANQTLTLRQQEGKQQEPATEPRPEPYFAFVPDVPGLTFIHRENPFIDFEREPLLPHMLSRLGPALAHADVNGDGLEDLFVGGAKDQSAALFFQQIDGTFQEIPVDAFSMHRAYEDVDALFLDVDGDRDLDLYVVSGGNFAAGEAAGYQDRIYLNNGFGTFAYSADALPEITSSGATVAANDLDQDGDLDLFVGGRVLSGQYPYPPRSYLLENTGGRFVDITSETSEALMKPGLVTDAVWADVQGDNTAELIVTGEWMPIRVFEHDGSGTFTETTDRAGLSKTNGWWNTLAAFDLDGDGDLDLVAGNRGRNAQMRASEDEPAQVHAADFDRNGSVDAILSYFIQGKSYPVPSRDELLEHMPRLAVTFPTYSSYADATTEDLLSEEQRDAALVLEAYTFATTVFENQGDGTFQVHELPLEAQVSPVNALLPGDANGDGLPDLLLAGNNQGVRAQWGLQNAGRGLLLMNRGGLDFEVLPASHSGFIAPGDVRRLALVRTAAGSLIVAANNNATLTTFTIQAPPVASLTPQAAAKASAYSE